jgi:hypothetical protein
MDVRPTGKVWVNWQGSTASRWAVDLVEYANRSGSDKHPSSLYGADTEQSPMERVLQAAATGEAEKPLQSAAARRGHHPGLRGV